MRAKAIYLTKAVLRRLYWAPADLRRHLRGEGRYPPRGLSFVGGADFASTGREFLEHFQRLSGLRPDHSVLDVGCGIGRMAIPLADYLDGGSYAGFDVGRAMIRWCRRHVSSERATFEFAWAPVYNAKYNPFGDLSATEFRFPYPDASFDFAFATSLFTHLLRDETRHYLAETGRVLRPGASCLLTFFLLTPESESEIAAGRAALPFVHEIDGMATTDPRLPEEAVAHRVEEVRTMLAEAGLELCEPIRFGSWANAPDAVAPQDLIVARRAP